MSIIVIIIKFTGHQAWNLNQMSHLVAVAESSRSRRTYDKLLDSIILGGVWVKAPDTNAAIVFASEKNIQRTETLFFAV